MLNVNKEMLNSKTFICSDQTGAVLAPSVGAVGASMARRSARSAVRTTIQSATGERRSVLLRVPTGLQAGTHHFGSHTHFA